jgi:hypothetical protein
MKTTLTVAAANLRAATAEAKAVWEAALTKYNETDNKTDARWLEVAEARERYLDLANARA